MVGIDGQWVVTLSVYVSLIISVWKLNHKEAFVLEGEKMKTNAILNHSWSKGILSIIYLPSQVNLVLVDYIFSNDSANEAEGGGGGRKKMLILLSDATVFLLDIESKSCLLKVNLKLLINVKDEVRRGTRCITNIAQHPKYGFDHVVFALGSSCYALDCSSIIASSSPSAENNSQLDPILEIVDEDIKAIHHVSFSKNGKYLSCCTGPSQGKVLLYHTQQNDKGCLSYQLLYRLPAIDPLNLPSPPLHALASDFSWTSEELIVCYSSSDFRVWQLPRTMNLREIARNMILKLCPEKQIDKLKLPKILKDYLHFAVV